MAREDLEEFRLSKLPVVKPKSLPKKVAPPRAEFKANKTLPHPTRSKSAGWELREGNRTVD
jgi:hypothetical protein